MRLLLANLLAMALVLSGVGQGEKEPLVYVKHLEPPLRYPAVARYARLQGVVTLKLAIASDGSVTSTETTAEDPLLQAHPLLQVKTEELVRKWTFGCFNCPPAGAYVHLLRFVWKLEGEERNYDDTKVVMDLPNQVIVTANPSQCDHCPPPRKSKK